MPRRVPTLLLILPLIMVLALQSGCQRLGYYGHLVAGQAGLLQQRQPVSTVLRDLERQGLEDPGRALLHRRLLASREILAFAEQELALPAGRRYRSYVTLDRPAVVWNLFAAPALSLEPHLWCYPLVGCAPYRGFFTEARAWRERQRLEAAGYEVHLGGVAAYSTLGWFADPLLSTFLTWPEPQLAELLFHELAHARIWVPGDVAFNESFANFVGAEGRRQWLAATVPDAAAAVDADSGWRRLRGLLTEVRDALQQVYRSEAEDALKEHAKARILQRAADCYLADRAHLGAGRFDGLMAELNNALLASLGTYEDWVPAFAALYREADGDWEDFYNRVGTLAAQPPSQRTPSLQALVDRHAAEAGDDHGAVQVHCAALADDIGRGDAEYGEAGYGET